MTEALKLDDLTFEVRRSARRKTLEITVERTGELILSAPEFADRNLLDGFVREKREWVYQKIAEKQSMSKPRPPRQFVTGEGFHYLGRSYRLQLVNDQDRPLKLTGGRFRLRRKDVADARIHFIRWYTSHGKSWLARRVPAWADRLGVEPHGVRVLDLRNRWGSCSSAGTLNIHWTTMQLPTTIIDYILVHELAHLIQPRHGPEFWRVVERALSDFDQRKRRLADQGHAYAGF